MNDSRRFLQLGTIVVVSVAFPIRLAAVIQSDRLGVRNGHAMTYDSDRSRVLLFGGADESHVLDDLWAWDGGTRKWDQLSAGGPGRRTFSALAYDHQRHQAVLFGGNRVLFGAPGQSGPFLGDTWLFADGKWTEVPVAGPSPRAEAGVAYDAQRGRVVLFGGYRADQAGKVVFGDTWEWDGSRWTQAAKSGPPPRNGSAMTYDADRRRVILFGGSGATNDTWAWDGTRWTQLAAGDPPGRYNTTMTYDAIRHRVLRFGGWNGKNRLDDTWTLGASAWIRIDVPGPFPRNHATLAYDGRRGRAVLFGGHDGEHVYGDTWEWDGSHWLEVRPAPPIVRLNNGH